MSSTETNVSFKIKTVVFGKDEPLAIPEEFKQSLGLDQGGSFTLVQFDSFLLLYPGRLKSSEALEKIRQALDQQGVMLDELLEGQRQIRQELWREKYETGE